MITLATAVGVDLPSGRELLALLPFLVLALGVVVYCLVDLVRARRVKHLPKAVWAVLIVLFSPPFGAIAYLVFGKDRYDYRDESLDSQASDVDKPSRV